ncbi:MAG: hypothetical protein R3E10_02835 [Gemmatimonadota bacterium]
MGIQGLRIERGGRTWEVTSAVRAGPQWRVILKGVDDPRCKLQTQVEGTRPPVPGTLTVAVQNPQYRWFVDREQTVWRAEVTPRYEYNQLIGNSIVFSSDVSQERHRYPYDGVEALGMVADIKLLELLLRAKKGL